MRKGTGVILIENVGLLHRPIRSVEGNFYKKVAVAWRTGCEQLDGGVAFEERVEEWVALEGRV